MRNGIGRLSDGKETHSAEHPLERERFNTGFATDLRVVDGGEAKPGKAPTDRGQA
jgi:hypothetical protein